MPWPARAVSWPEEDPLWRLIPGVPVPGTPRRHHEHDGDAALHDCARLCVRQGRVPAAVPAGVSCGAQVCLDTSQRSCTRCEITAPRVLVRRPSTTTPSPLRRRLRARPPARPPQVRRASSMAGAHAVAGQATRFTAPRRNGTNATVASERVRPCASARRRLWRRRQRRAQRHADCRPDRGHCGRCGAASAGGPGRAGGAARAAEAALAGLPGAPQLARHGPAHHPGACAASGQALCVSLAA